MAWVTLQVLLSDDAAQEGRRSGGHRPDHARHHQGPQEVQGAEPGSPRQDHHVQVIKRWSNCG